MINKGDVICKMNDQLPITDLFEAEVDILELLSYKPILSKGYQCILHIHTVADEATVKDIIVAYEKNEKGEIIEKHKPQFTKSYSKIICRIQTRVPIPLEKHDFLVQMGRFTLRDEGKTIAVGKVLKYKPVKVNPYAGQTTEGQALPTGTESKQITQVDAHKKEDLVFDMDSGETVTKEEYQRRQKERAAKELEGINEDEEDEGDEDDDEDDEGT